MMRSMDERTLTRQEASDAVEGLGWRYVLGALRTHVAVRSLTEAARIAAAAVAACGADADGHLRADLRPDRVVLTAQSARHAAVTDRDAELARLITDALHAAGARTDAEAERPARSAQILEIAIDAMDIPAVRPFWQAVMGYVSEPGSDGPVAPLVDPLGQGPAIWFQRMDRPRPQRNRLHLDVSVPHDEAAHRIAATLAAGGRLLSATAAPAFWVLADPEDNEACVTTWQGRD